MDTISFQVNTF